jgi:hypothetical protein
VWWSAVCLCVMWCVADRVSAAMQALEGRHEKHAHHHHADDKKEGKVRVLCVHCVRT